MRPVATPLKLGCGLTLSNRLAKAAMTEGLADFLNAATPAHAALYGRWADGGLGLLITGNIQVCRRHLERPGNIAIEGEPTAAQMAGLQALAAAARRQGGRILAQLSHAGRQTPAALNPAPQAPSAVPLALPGRQFAAPRAMTESEILDLIQRFALAAHVCEAAGFDGVQLHAAHGYLISSFLSPLSNRRSDRWGGSLSNRARFLLSAVRAVRAATRPAFALSVKLNSADFQRGGFALEESAQVARMLADEGVDLLEVSGGTYEQPRMMDADGLTPGEARSARREAYFLAEAGRLRDATNLPLMVTGGFRTAAAMDAALSSGAVDMIGLARPLCVEPDGARRLLSDTGATLPAPERNLRLGPGPFSPRSRLAVLRMLNAIAAQAWFCQQILSLADRGSPDPRLSPFRALVRHQRREAQMARSLVRRG